MKVTIRNLLLIITLNLMILPATHAQGVETLSQGQKPAHADLSQFSWLQGYWTGSGFGGFCDEMWLPPLGNSMQGIFRFAEGDTLIFSEFMVLIEADSSVTLRLKHFSADLRPWEEKDKWVDFELVRVEGQTAWFDGLTYARTGDELLILLKMHQGKKEWVEEFRFRLRQP